MFLSMTFTYYYKPIIENYYKPVRVGNFWSNNYIEYKSNGDKNKTLSVKEYLISY